MNLKKIGFILLALFLLIYMIAFISYHKHLNKDVNQEYKLDRSPKPTTHHTLESKQSSDILPNLSERTSTDLGTKFGFSREEIRQEMKRQEQLKEYYSVSAIFLHWRRTVNLHYLIPKLVNESGIKFNEIIIWNNNPDIKLEAKVFGNLPIPIKIINSNENIKDQAKYLACASASSRVCYYQDDDWMTLGYIKSTYYQFLMHPTLIHSNTDAYTYYTNFHWSAFKPEISLHTQFTWIGCGSFFLRELAIEFIMQAQLELPREYFTISDVFFSIWRNEPPYMMCQSLVQLNQNHGFSDETNFFKLQKYAQIASIKILYDKLISNSKLFRRQLSQDLERIGKSSCPKDNCIFITNVHIKPWNVPMENASFNIEKDINRITRDNLPACPFCSHSYKHAVDNNENTFWLGHGTTNSYFGLDLLKIRKAPSITITFGHSYQRELKVEISLNGKEWRPIQLLMQMEAPSKITYLGISTSNTPEWFRYIRFVTTKEYNEPFKVFEINYK